QHGGMRSTPATVLGVAEPIRILFARANGAHPSWFRANARGACPLWRGTGVVVTDLAFLDDVRTECDGRGGNRFNDRALGATLNGRSIVDVLAMSPASAADLLADHREVARRLRWLDRVGIGHLSIGRSLDTLSGGERQRLLLAAHLV